MNDLKKYFANYIEKLNQQQKEAEEKYPFLKVDPRYEEYMAPENFVPGAGLVKAGRIAVGNVAPKLMQKIVDKLTPQVTEAGLPLTKGDALKMQFEGLRRMLQKAGGTGAANVESKTMHDMAGRATEMREAAALRKNTAKPKVSDEQIALDRYNMDRIAEEMASKRLENIRRSQSASEATIPGIIEELKKKK